MTGVATLIVLAAFSPAGGLPGALAGAPQDRISCEQITSACGVGRQGTATLIACLNHGRFEYFSRPKRCDLFSRSGPVGHQSFRDIRTRGLRWKKWGGPQGEGEGTDSGGLPLTVVPYHRVRCHGAAYYTLAKVTRTRGGRTYRLKLARCGEVRFEDS